MNPPNNNLVQVLVLTSCVILGGATYFFLTRNQYPQSQPAAAEVVRQLPPPSHPVTPNDPLARLRQRRFADMEQERLAQVESNATSGVAPSPANLPTIAEQMDAAATKGDLKTVSNLFAAHPELIDARNAWGSTPLTDASYNGRDAVVAWLLAHDADVNTQNNMLWTPLIHAARRGHIGAVRLLLANHADVSLKTNYGKTALDFAHEFHWPEVEALLTGQNVQTNENPHGLAPPR